MHTTPHEWPRNSREDDNVKPALMVGMVACESCRQVHIDFVDAEGNIFATGSLDFEVWLQVALKVDDEIRGILGQH